MNFFNTPQQGFRFLGPQICTPKAFRYMENFTRITLNNPPPDFDLSTMWNIGRLILYFKVIFVYA